MDNLVIMNYNNHEEHVLHENPYIAEVTLHLEARYPHRLVQLSPIDITVIASGLQEVQEKYGEASDVPLKYHGIRHTRDVWEDYCMYADILGLDSDEFVDGGIAVTHHDWEQLLGPGANETASAIEVQRVMSATGYDEGRQMHSANCVLATEVVFDEQGKLIQKHLKTFGPDTTILAVTLADMNGITIRGEQTMIDHAFRLALELSGMQFYQLKKDPSRFIDMLKNQYTYVGARLSTLEDAVRFHVPDQEKASGILGELDARYATQSSRAINAAKSLYESISNHHDQVSRRIGSYASKAMDEAEFLRKMTGYTTRQALARIARKNS